MLAQDDKVVQFIIDKASHTPWLQKLLLFGSRARGDARTRSDYDFAVHAVNVTHAEWARFHLGIEDEKPTLCGIDIVLLTNQLPRDFNERIMKEGIVVYERK